MARRNVRGSLAAALSSCVAYVGLMCGIRIVSLHSSTPPDVNLAIRMGVAIAITVGLAVDLFKQYVDPGAGYGELLWDGIGLVILCDMCSVIVFRDEPLIDRWLPMGVLFQALFVCAGTIVASVSRRRTHSSVHDKNMPVRSTGRPEHSADGNPSSPEYPSPMSQTEQLDALLDCESSKGLHVVFAADIRLVLASGSRLGQRGDDPLVHISVCSHSRWQAALKRLLDLVLSVIALAVAFPVIAAAALAIKVTSPGSAFYAQTRVGLGGKEFRIIKLRTMVQDAESQTGPVLASSDDARVTRVGRILRATRIDELPQLLNVIAGHMSIVGPRPERPHFVDRFRDTIPGYDLRHCVRPGITGFAQIRGRYATDARSKLVYDLWYIQNYSLFLDAYVLLHTIRTVLTPSAAEGATVAERPRRHSGGTATATERASYVSDASGR